MPEITVVPSGYEGVTVYEISARGRCELMDAVVRITGTLSFVEEFRPHVERAGAQLEVANAPADNRTIH